MTPSSQLGEELRKRPNPAVTDALVRGGADLGLRDQYGRTALHVAAQGRGNAAAFVAPLEPGADSTAVDDEGKTRLDYARENTALWGLEVLKPPPPPPAPAAAA